MRPDTKRALNEVDQFLAPMSHSTAALSRAIVACGSSDTSEDETALTEALRSAAERLRRWAVVLSDVTASKTPDEDPQL